MAVAFGVRYDYEPGELRRAMSVLSLPIARAATAAIKTVGNQAKIGGRKSIAGAGFSRKWQNAYRLHIYPKHGTSIDASAYLVHNIHYAGVFETGAIIRGNPILYLPLRNAPKKIGGKRMTPRNYIASGGSLFRINRGAGKPPLLATKARFPSKKSPLRVTASQLKRGRTVGSRGRLTTVPLFVGLSLVNIRKRFNIAAATRAAAARLPGLYYDNLKVD